MDINRFEVYLVGLDPTHQIRTIDKSRLTQKLGVISKPTQQKVLSILSEMFAP